MALASTGIIEFQSAATAGNVNGGYFNPANANTINDGAVLVGTSSAPTISSTIGAFVAADVGAWIWFPTQTNMNAGSYKIISVNAGVATLSAAIGSTNVDIYLNNMATRPTVQGCATTASPTNVSFLVDYSRSPTAIATFSNLGSSSGSTTVTDNSSGGLMRKTMAGNGLCLSAGTNALKNCYEVVSVTNSNNIVLDVSPHGANTMSSTTGNIGGAVSLGGSTAGITDSDWMNTMIPTGSTATAAMRYFVLGGTSITYTLGVACTFKQGSATWPTMMEGYVTARGDRPQGATRPTFACGANSFTKSGQMFSIIFTGTAASVLGNGAAQTGGALTVGCKIVNSSATAARVALLQRNSGSGTVYNNEIISYRGIAIQDVVATTNSTYMYNYIHDSDTGFQITNATVSPVVIRGNIVEGCVTYSIDGVNVIPPYLTIDGNTFYGAENKLGIAIGIQTADAQTVTVLNNIFYGFATALSIADVQASVGQGDYNNFFNNTSDFTANHWQRGVNDLALNPLFTSVAQVKGTTATTTAGNHLVDSGQTFVTKGVTAGRDYVYVVSGTGVTVGIYGILSVDSETQITTDITLTANAVADKTYQITTGHNFAIGVNLKGMGFPGAFPGGLSTGSSDIGAVSRIEAGMIRARSFGGM